MNALRFLFLAVAAGVLFLGARALPPVRALDAPIRLHVESYYVRHALEQTRTPNLVTAILADYRGYDTFGETTVIFAAGLACYFLLRGTKP
ncbi:MAG: hypothetical protein KatS3mg076_1744 [Candidatus Binatia bacterium]|nr:MAG: hypothetical protein KatS3mg076_1744 [Candidatus Binatia bacterium]